MVEKFGRIPTRNASNFETAAADLPFSNQTHACVAHVVWLPHEVVQVVPARAYFAVDFCYILFLVLSIRSNRDRVVYLY